MEKWGIRAIEFDPEVEAAIESFVAGYPGYKKMLEDRINDLLNFPELLWASAFLDPKDPDRAVFITHHQQIDLAGKAYRRTGTAYITHFEFHR